MSEPFHGVLPALITPFTADGGTIDTGSLRAVVERLVGAGAGGLVPGGSTGEFTTLTNAERRRLVEVTVEAAAGRVPVVAGTGALSTRETVELSVHAEQAGAAAVMVVPPFYDALSWRELLAHYTAVADAIDVPIMYYNLPSATGVRLTAPQLRELPVTCLKDTGGDAVAATELIQTDGPTLLNGWDTLTFAALRPGARPAPAARRRRDERASGAARARDDGGGGVPRVAGPNPCGGPAAVWLNASDSPPEGAGPMPARTLPPPAEPLERDRSEPEDPAPPAPPEPPLTEADLLVEDVSIDGMCGVY
jgi:mycofactocin precursor